jgi:hypothetical protein
MCRCEASAMASGRESTQTQNQKPCFPEIHFFKVCGDDLKAQNKVCVCVRVGLWGAGVCDLKYFKANSN